MTAHIWTSARISYPANEAALTYRSHDAAADAEGDRKAWHDSDLPTRIGDAQHNEHQVEGQNRLYTHSLRCC